MMDFQLSEEPVATLPEHAEVSIAYEYDRILELTIVDNGLGGFVLSERVLDAKQTKDYDSIDRVSSWAERFDVS
ncbi:MAG: hypothetical protein K2Z81_02630, partial [Cyanobacteria bacterium]|nr:hypothetical protein [Cyanobacteriota bacterium]